MSVEVLTWLCSGNDNIRNIIGRSLGGATFPPKSVLTTIRLDNATLTGATLQHVVFEGGTAAGADFTAADLTCCRLNQTGLDFAKFSRARLTGSALQAIEAVGVRFSQAALEDACIDKCSFDEAVFTQAKMLGAKVRFSRFIRVHFDGADLRASHFVHCYFEECTFSHALITGALFDDNCTFERCDLVEAIRA
jgi:uncharacterized protein YjbI with pentapeptide repeats